MVAEASVVVMAGWGYSREGTRSSRVTFPRRVKRWAGCSQLNDGGVGKIADPDAVGSARCEHGLGLLTRRHMAQPSYFPQFRVGVCSREGAAQPSYLPLHHLEARLSRHRA